MDTLSIFFTLMTGFFSFLLALLIWMRFVEPRRFQINRHEIRLRKPLAAPLRILHISDTHFCGPDRGMEQFFDRLSEEETDLVLITGDIIDSAAGISHCTANLRKLRPKIAALAVLGNHDYYNYSLTELLLHNFPGQKPPQNRQRVDLLVESLSEAGIQLLRNETCRIEFEGSPVLIHGLDDLTTRHAKIYGLKQHMDPDAINLLLTHSIDIFRHLEEGLIDLALSGHSHGGQVCLPFHGPVITHTSLGRKYADGIRELKGAVCCISRGIGTSRYAPVRLLCPPEAVMLTVTGRD